MEPSQLRDLRADLAAIYTELAEIRKAADRAANSASAANWNVFACAIMMTIILWQFWKH